MLNVVLASHNAVSCETWRWNMFVKVLSVFFTLKRVMDFRHCVIWLLFSSKFLKRQHVWLVGCIANITLAFSVTGPVCSSKWRQREAAWIAQQFFPFHKHWHVWMLCLQAHAGPSHLSSWVTLKTLHNSAEITRTHDSYLSLDLCKRSWLRSWNTSLVCDSICSLPVHFTGCVLAVTWELALGEYDIMERGTPQVFTSDNVKMF